MRCRPLEQTARPRPKREVVAVMRDVTERKSQEQALEEARSEAERAHAAKSQFLATMSHELRTPLNAIIGFSEMIVQEDELSLDAARRNEYAQLINDSGQHLLSVVNGILDMSKMESGGFEISAEPFAPREAIMNCCNLMALKARENGIDLVVRLPEDLPGHGRRPARVQADPAQSRCRTRSSSPSAAAPSRCRRRSRRSRLMLEVSDTGVGIAPDDLKRIGDPFFQAGKTYRRRHEGTGLGLSIVKWLVALHQGEMNVQSKVDVGTTISVVLPLAFAPSAVELNSPSSPVLREPSSNVATLKPALRSGLQDQAHQVKKSA